MISGVLLGLTGVIYEGEKAPPGALDSVARLRHAGHCHTNTLAWYGRAV
jgi:ribonucleotide monophosphatase NagD (HAD superfamily)